MMKMILIGQKRVLFLPQTVYDHTYHIEQGYYQSGKGQHHVGVSGYFGVICTAQMNDQQTDDITQNQTSRVPHKQFVSSFGVTKHIVEPERHNHTEG